MNTPRVAAADRRVPLAFAVLALVLACLGTANIAGSAPGAPLVTVAR